MNKVMNLFGLLLIAGFSVLIAGCGGGDDNGGEDQSLVGSYVLTGFKLEADGFVITQDNVGSFSGSLIIRSDYRFSTSVTLNSARESSNGTITVISDSTLMVHSGGESLLNSYYFRGSTLTLIESNSDGKLTQVWQKISD